MQKRLVSIAASLALLFAGAAATSAQQVTAIPKLEENTLVGVWYQVAQIPTKRETKRCKSNMLEVIALGEKTSLQIVDSCTAPKGYPDAVNRTAKRDKAQDGKLKLGFLFPFTGKYWILAQAPTPTPGAQPAWFLAGNPNHHSLWIYSKTPTLPPDTLMQIESLAATQGFPTTKLVPVTQ